jgi:transcriptional regulator with XRE-family HTH domain
MSMTGYSHIAKIRSSPQRRTFVKDAAAALSHPANMARGAANKSVNHLRAWREYRKMTQDDLAAKIGTAGNVISLLESGGRRLSDKWLYKLAPALDTRPGFLLEFDPNDVDQEILEAYLKLSPSAKKQAAQMLLVLATGTNS